MSVTDSLIGIGVIGIFFFIIGSKVYKHEKENIDPIIAKIKGWFNKDEDSSEDTFDPSEDYDLAFKGQLK